LILWANVLEQAPPAACSRDLRARHASAVSRCARLLPARALRDLQGYEGCPRPAAGRPGLATLFDIDDAAPFLDAWPHRSFRGSGPVERLAGLVDYDFEELCTMRRSFTRAFLHPSEKGPKFVEVPGGSEQAHYDAGRVLYFHSLRSPGVDAWVSAIDRELGLLPGATRVSAFASRRGGGLRPHYDQNDNFVCQARGVKRWRVAPNEHVRYPTIGYTIGAKLTPALRAEAPNGFPAQMPTPHETVDLRPGSVVFMPRGTWHDTETIESESLHFNIQTGLATWKDAVEFVMRTTPALHSEALRAPVLALPGAEVAGDSFEGQLRQKLQLLVEAICAGEIPFDREAFAGFVAKRRSAI
jgi:hypothetical protein